MKNKTKQIVLLVLIPVILIIIIVSIIFTGNEEKDLPKVGLVLTGTKADSGWNSGHYEGAKYACDKLGAELIVIENVPEDSKQCEDAIRKLAKDDAAMIILSSYAYPMLVTDVIAEYPDIAFYGSSAEFTADNMTSYFGRMYQARYLAGIVAGMKTESNQIGYVASMPNAEVNRGINAFTLGVKSVNPDATVYVMWTGSWENESSEIKATERLIAEVSADVITYHQNQHYVAQTADEAGIYSIGYNEEVKGLSDKYLTAAVWNWKALYYQIVRELMLNETNTVRRHWFGMDTGVVELSEFSSCVDEDTIRQVETAKQEILSGKDVFSGVIYDNTGELRCDVGETISDEILLNQLDWYVDGVVIYE